MQTSKQITGSRGEEVANAFLQTIGLRVVDRNVRLGKKEIDIIAYDPVEQTIVFIEVKSQARAHEDFYPEMNLRWQQKETLKLAAENWLAEMECENFYRFDLLTVINNAVALHLKDYTRT